MLSPLHFPYALRLIGALAADIHEMKTIREHIDDLPKRARQAVTDEMLALWSYESSGYDDPRAYLDHLHTALGYRHLDMVRALQRWLVVRDPRLADPDYEVNVRGSGMAREREAASV